MYSTFPLKVTHHFELELCCGPSSSLGLNPESPHPAPVGVPSTEDSEQFKKATHPHLLKNNYAWAIKDSNAQMLENE